MNKSLYRKRANTPCPGVQLAYSRFRYNPKTYRDLALCCDTGRLKGRFPNIYSAGFHARLKF